MAGGVYSQTVQVIIEAILKGQDKVAEAVKNYKAMGSQYENVTKSTISGALKQKKALDAVATKQKFLRNWSEKLGVSGQRVSKIMGASDLAFDKSGKVINTMGGAVKDLDARMRKGKASTTRFKMEFLGVMFAGMALYRVFSGLIKKQLELYGVTEMFGAMLTVTFGPIMDVLAPILYSLMELFMNLPENVQLAIGVFTLLGLALGAIMMLFGQTALGINSLAALFKVSASTIGIAIAGIVLIIAGIGLVIKGVTDIVNNWGKDWIKVIKGVSIALIGLSLIILGIALIIGSVPLAIAAAGVAIVAVVVWIVTTIIKHWDKIKEFVKNVVESIVGFFKWLWEKLVGHSIIPDIVNGIISWFKKLPSAIFNFIKGIPTKILGVFKGIGQQIYDMIMPKSVKNVLGWVSKGVKSTANLLGFAEGGTVPGPVGKPMMAMVHGGETITPPGKTSGSSNVFSPTININASISSDYDVRKLAEGLKRYWVTDFERVAQGRGI